MSALVLDAEALSTLARNGHHERTVRAALTAALVEESDVIVPAAVLAELYRGSGYDQAVDSCLAREGGIDIAPTDRSLARLVGHLLAAAGCGSEHHVDATVVAVCATSGGGVILTGDSHDLKPLAGGNPAIAIRPLGGS